MTNILFKKKVERLEKELLKVKVKLESVRDSAFRLKMKQSVKRFDKRITLVEQDLEDLNNYAEFNSDYLSKCIGRIEDSLGLTSMRI
jgi:hypothetical protein